MPVTQARLPGFQSAKSARWYQALIGPIQATGSAGGFDLAKRMYTKKRKTASGLIRRKSQKNFLQGARRAPSKPLDFTDILP